MGFPLPDNEATRLAELQDHEILDTPPDEAFDRITRLACRVLCMPMALVSLVDERRVWFKSRSGLEIEEVPRENAFCADAIMNAGVMVVRDATAGPRFADNPLVKLEPALRFYAGAPLKTKRDHVLGTLWVGDRKPRDLDALDRAALTDLAAMAVDELELRRLMATDALTGAVNRHHFLELAHREERRAQRYGYTMSVAILQLDDFAAVVDAHGSAAGDRLVQALAGMCSDTMRETDILARFGGEVLVILMPHTDEAGAARMGERLREGTEALRVGTDAASLRVTACVGVASCPVGLEDFDVTLQRADNALFKARSAGPNRVNVAPPTVTAIPVPTPRSDCDAVARAGIARAMSRGGLRA